MNAKTPSRPVLVLLASAVAGVLATGFASLASAGGSLQVPEATVNYSDLSVSSSRGATVLYGRIRAAAEGLCSPLYHGDLSSRMHRNACVQQSIADAVGKVNQAALFAVYNAKNERPLPMIVAAGQR